jgi:LysR family hydrogen peroxide-inducible transcriptional activator
MTLTELRYLVAVADERHFGQAAARCFVSQPSLSAAIKNIESELGVRIFERSKAGVILTDVGINVVAQARRTLGEAARVKTIAQQGKNQLNGVLRLGVIPTIAPYLLPALTIALHKLAPKMTLDIEEAMTANLDQLLKAGELDAVIIALPFQAPGIEVRALYDEDFFVVVPSGHPLCRKGTVIASELDAGELLMLPVGNCLRDQVLDSCSEFSRPPSGGRQGSSLETLRSMVASGLGITVLPAMALVERYASPLVKAIPFASPVPQRRVALAWRRGFGRPLAIKRIVDAIVLTGSAAPIQQCAATEPAG